MSKLTAKTRDSLSDNAFALRGHKYPIEDAAHARNAKARATQQQKAGHLSAADKKTVDARAERVLNG